jgi:pyruvate formate lyase activating enzyme
MHEALFYQQGEDEDQLICNLCNHHCRIREGGRGICRVRENRQGTLYSLVYGRLVADHVDPVEKKPLFHFQPGSRSFSISTVGCNFRCKHCQNADISQYPRQHENGIAGAEWSPEEVVDGARRHDCQSISYTYVEPTIFYEFAYDCAVLAREQGIKNIFVSNGYMTPEVTRHLAPLLDGINIDIKAMSEEFYHEVCKARLAPVLENVRLFHELGVWVEVTTLLIPGWNDSDEELQKIARFIRDVDPAIPWHVTAFYPSYKMMDRLPTPVRSLRRAREIGLDEGLRFVYEGNVPGEGGECTYCPACGSELISRHGFQISSNRLTDGKCGQCGAEIEGVWS